MLINGLWYAHLDWLLTRQKVIRCGYWVNAKCPTLRKPGCGIKTPTRARAEETALMGGTSHDTVGPFPRLFRRSKNVRHFSINAFRSCSEPM
eukprot:8214601-Pyramimonas_sp.AAC.1